MKIINATPPANFPEQVVVAQDDAFIKRNPEAAYWLRVRGLGANVEVYQLPCAVGPSHAKKIAQNKGFNPTHWINSSEGVAHPF